MQDFFAALPSIGLKAQKELLCLNSRLLLLQRKWTRSLNLGPAYSLSEFARFWEIPERTIRHYAKEGILPGLFRVGKRQKIRKTKESFEFGRAILAAQQARAARRFTDENKSIIHFAVGMIENTKRDLFLDSAHSQNLPEDTDPYARVGEILLDRIKAFEGVGELSPQSVFQRLEDETPADPVAKMTHAERSVRQSHLGVYAWVSVAAALNQSGVRPTRERIAQKMGMSRATFTRKFPEAKWAVIKAAVSDWMNNAQPIQSTGRKNRKTMI